MIIDNDADLCVIMILHRTHPQLNHIKCPLRNCLIYKSRHIIKFGSGVMSGTAMNLDFFQKLGFGDANL